ncbi:MAG: hypothetical protein HXY40_11125 [Chloroflexi bacterium]|nr:hypothetical protein [Chloroflexota bacterium]
MGDKRLNPEDERALIDKARQQRAARFLRVGATHDSPLRPTLSDDLAGTLSLWRVSIRQLPRATGGFAVPAADRPARFSFLTTCISLLAVLLLLALLLSARFFALPPANQRAADHAPCRYYEVRAAQAAVYTRADIRSGGVVATLPQGSVVCVIDTLAGQPTLYYVVLFARGASDMVIGYMQDRVLQPVTGEVRDFTPTLPPGTLVRVTLTAPPPLQTAPPTQPSG